MGFASGSRDAVLSTLCEDVAANGTAPLLTGLSFADIAATAGVSASSVRRAVRTLDRLDALVSSHLGRAGIDTRADLRLSGAPRERRLHPGQPGAIAGVIDAAIDMQSNPRSLPSAALWGRLHIPHVRATSPGTATSPADQSELSPSSESPPRRSTVRVRMPSSSFGVASAMIA